MKLAFASDWHLDFLNHDKRIAFLKSVSELDVDGIIVAGDISTGNELEKHLVEINRFFNKPFYFVHGNHDFFNSSFYEVRDRSFELTQDLDLINWLECKPVQLSNNVVIYGVDGWYDCGYGDYFFPKFDFQMLDFDLIKELKHKTKEERLKVFEVFANIGANNIRRTLPKLLEENKTIILVTHVPPFTKLSKHMGKQSDVYALPYFCSKVIGEAIIEVKEKYPDKELIVLCGHTHDEAEFSLDNMFCMCASANYSVPSIYKIIEVK